MDALKKSVAADKGADKANKAKSKKSDDLRKQPQFKFPIEGGKAKQPKTVAVPASKAKPKQRARA